MKHDAPVKNPPRDWRATPRWRVRLGAEIAIGPGKADLLEAIARTGSISAAAESLKMSYRRAWILVETMNRCFAGPLVATSRRRQEGAHLTEEGRQVLNLYRRIESLSARAARAPLGAMGRLLRDRPSPRAHGRGSPTRQKVLLS
jgi:molybdate transport system regulatory protein